MGNWTGAFCRSISDGFLDFCNISVAIESYHIENTTEEFTVPSDLVES